MEIMIGKRRMRGRRCEGMLRKKKHMRHELNLTCRWIRSNWEPTNATFALSFFHSLSQATITGGLARRVSSCILKQREQTQ
jgi:hypothetical protein